MSKRPIDALFRPAMVLMTGRFFGFVVAFAIPMVLARLFDQSEFGTYKQLFLVYATLFGIAQFGMAESLYYFLPYETSRSGSFVVNTLIALAGMGCIGVAVLWVFQEQLAVLLNNPVLPQFLMLIAIYAVFQLMSCVLEIVMTVRKQHMAASFAYAASDLARAFLFIVPLFFFTELYWLMMGAIAYAIIRLSATLIYVKREFRHGLKPDAPSLRKQLGYAIPFGVAALIEMLQMQYHMYAVSYHFDTATFAIYAVGCLQIPLVDFLMSSTCNVMMVNMRERMLANDFEALVAIWLDSIRKLALIFFPIVAVLLVTADLLIVLLFTSAYERSIPIFMVWTVSMLFVTLLTDGVLRVFAETRFLIVQNIIRLAVIAIFIQMFMVRFGLVGAILVTLLATLVAKTVALYRIRKVMNVSLAKLLPWHALGMTFVIASVAMLPAMLARSLFTMPAPVLLILTGGVYTLSYYALLQFCGPMQASEKQMLARWLQLPFIRIGKALKIQSTAE